MNELLFLMQTLVVVGFVYGALKLGKEALVACAAMMAVVANLFVIKQISLFGLDVTASDAFAIGSLLCLNFLQEYFNQEEAEKALRSSFLLMTFFTLASQLHLLYTPNSYDATHSAFVEILSLSPRLLTASIVVFLVTQQVDIRLFGFFKNRFHRLSFALRSGLTLLISQLLDTTLFSFLGLYGVVASLIEIIVLSYLIKLFVIGSMTVATKLIKPA